MVDDAPRSYRATASSSAETNYDDVDASRGDRPAGHGFGAGDGEGQRAAAVVLDRDPIWRSASKTEPMGRKSRLRVPDSTKQAPVVLTRRPRASQGHDDRDPVADEPVRQLQLVTWGLVPSWSKDTRIGLRISTQGPSQSSTKPGSPRQQPPGECQPLVLELERWAAWLDPSRTSTPSANCCRCTRLAVSTPTQFWTRSTRRATK